jgi:hypothetical protein
VVTKDSGMVSIEEELHGTQVEGDDAAAGAVRDVL